MLRENYIFSIIISNVKKMMNEENYTKLVFTDLNAMMKGETFTNDTLRAMPVWKSICSLSYLKAQEP